MADDSTLDSGIRTTHRSSLPGKLPAQKVSKVLGLCLCWRPRLISTVEITECVTGHGVSTQLNLNRKKWDRILKSILDGCDFSALFAIASTEADLGVFDQVDDSEITLDFLQGVQMKDTNSKSMKQ